MTQHETTPATETDLVYALAALLTDSDLTDDGSLEVDGVNTFAEAGLMTSNEGLVLRLTTGEQFQLRVIRSN